LPILDPTTEFRKERTLKRVLRSANVGLTWLLLSAALAAANAAADRRPSVTVLDSIQMSTFDNPNYALGTWRHDDIAAFSPDGKHFVVIAKTGNLIRNTVDYQLLLFDTSNVNTKPVPTVLAALSSSSTRPAIEAVNWLDNDTLAFMGENAGERHQVFSVDRESKNLRRRTNEMADVVNFAFSADRKAIFFSRARSPRGVDDKQSSVIVAGDSLPQALGVEFDTLVAGRDLLVLKEDVGSPSLIRTRGLVEGSPLWPSPDARYLVVKSSAELDSVPGSWFEYKTVSEGSVLAKRGVSTVEQYELIDLTTGASQPLVDAPVAAWYSNVAWSADSRSVVVSGTDLPLDMIDLAERERRKANIFVVEVAIPSKVITPITQNDANIRFWNTQSNLLVLQLTDHEVYSTFAERGLASFHKNQRGWVKDDGARANVGQNRVEVAVHEDMNTPPRLFVRDLSTGRRAMLLDPNPQFRKLRFAQVEEISVVTVDGRPTTAGIYLPPHRALGTRCPLVIQTHGWTADQFWIDGPDTTAMAAQALAGKGLVVVQVGDEIAAEINTRHEGRAATELFEAIVDYLDARHIIDPKRLGIEAFSYTGPAVEAAIAHSRYHFTAAVVADSSNLGYFSYIAFYDFSRNLWTNRAEASYGGPPFGESLMSWVDEAPNFNLESVHTAVRFEANSRLSVLAYWEWYVAFRKLGKPVELIVTPEAGHVSTRPRDRLVSQGGAVDWFDFWLNGHEDLDPSKAEQYRRWEQLCDMQVTQNPNQPAFCVRAKAH
jgi:dipeptidyl aminopeptidase/acylaminoacyl peptidase